MATTSAHAQESYRTAELPCCAAAHAEGDGDQVPADSDQPVPHHHGACHGHSLSTPVAAAALPRMVIAVENPDAPVMSRLAKRMVGPALEPPRI
ncbi:hypothetical protein [Sphingomonas caeni]|uniref:hypothetical protein n=1 Tax=Sphingomonas caeni TaxID=2984949 RepID=UPI00222E7C3A|nr:hypothetical protein [Sphingomonas caeni]